LEPGPLFENAISVGGNRATWHRKLPLCQTSRACLIRTERPGCRMFGSRLLGLGCTSCDLRNASSHLPGSPSRKRFFSYLTPLSLSDPSLLFRTHSSRRRETGTPRNSLRARPRKLVSDVQHTHGSTPRILYEVVQERGAAGPDAPPMPRHVGGIGILYMWQARWIGCAIEPNALVLLLVGQASFAAPPTVGATSCHYPACSTVMIDLKSQQRRLGYMRVLNLS